MTERPVTRTFQPRRRKLSPARQRVLDTEGPRWMVPTHGPQLDLADTFGRVAPAVVEIGIGRAEALVAMAADDPATDVIGVDVHTPGIAAGIIGIAAHALSNLRLVHGDALEFVDRLAPGSLAGMRIFFPDPWPKPNKRHKRLVTRSNLDRLVPLLVTGGFVHLATDIDDYAEQMQQVCDAHPALEGGVIERPIRRPETRYERKGLDAGRQPVDLWYVRNE